MSVRDRDIESDSSTAQADHGRFRNRTARKAATIKDKTLVVWVVPANATQRGGSALTLMEGEDLDAMGRFPPGELRGDARVAGGKLWLNGRDAYMVSAPPDTDDQAMFYAPKRPDTGVMWDTWLYHHAGVYHLYYLAKSGPEWDNISMATSADGVHWKERGVILRKGQGVTWMGTGSTWRSPNHAQDGRFQMNFTLLHGGPTYFSRFFPTNPDGLLANHHAIAKNGRIHLGLLKRAVVDAQGTLRLAWWPGNDKLKHQCIAVRIPADRAGGQPIAMLENDLPTDDGIILEGPLPQPAGTRSEPRGLYVECSDQDGVAILVRAGGVAEFGSIKPDSSGFKSDLRVNRDMSFGDAARFRLVLKRWLLEFYLDDILIECYSLPARATGKIGVIGVLPPNSSLSAWN